MPRRRTPLAWKNLTHDPRRLAVACAGIGFAVLLMFVQVGFENALFVSQVRLINDLEGDIFITSQARFALAAEKRFPRALLYQAEAVEGVAAAAPLYAEWTTSVLKNLSPGKSAKGYRIRTFGYRLDQPVFKSPRVQEQAGRLRSLQTALIDARSKAPNFDFPVGDPERLRAAPAELAGQRVSLVGAFKLGADFVHDGNLVMSAASLARYFPYRNRRGDPLAAVDIGVVRIAPGERPADVRDRIAAKLGGNVWVHTRRDLRRREMRFWRQSTPIGVVFWAGKVIGFVVGVVICYQVIFSGISDHMPEFATLKAMGYNNAYFTRLIVTEALWLSAMGFVPGALVSWALYAWLGGQTGLQMDMTPDVLLLVLGSTIAMCVVSGLLAVRKLLTADPASLF
ncbi:MAG: FtsX-like permease family protein [Planctomycetota bacterium]